MQIPTITVEEAHRYLEKLNNYDIYALGVKSLLMQRIK